MKNCFRATQMNGTEIVAILTENKEEILEQASEFHKSLILGSDSTTIKSLENSDKNVEVLFMNFNVITMRNLIEEKFHQDITSRTAFALKVLEMFDEYRSDRMLQINDLSPDTLVIETS